MSVFVLQKYEGNLLGVIGTDVPVEQMKARIPYNKVSQSYCPLLWIKRQSARKLSPMFDFVTAVSI